MKKGIFIIGICLLLTACGSQGELAVTQIRPGAQTGVTDVTAGAPATARNTGETEKETSEPEPEAVPESAQEPESVQEPEQPAAEKKQDPVQRNKMLNAYLDRLESEVTDYFQHHSVYVEPDTIHVMISVDDVADQDRNDLIKNTEAACAQFFEALGDYDLEDMNITIHVLKKQDATAELLTVRNGLTVYDHTEEN